MALLQFTVTKPIFIAGKQGRREKQGARFSKADYRRRPSLQKRIVREINMNALSRIAIAGSILCNIAFAAHDYLDAVEISAAVDNKAPMLKAEHKDKQETALRRRLAGLEQQNAALKEEVEQKMQQHQTEINRLQQSHIAELKQLTQYTAAQQQSASKLATDPHQACVDSFINAKQFDAEGNPLLIADTLRDWVGKTEATLLGEIAAETSPEQLFQLARQVRALNNQDLDADISRKLLQNVLYLDEDKQSELLALLENAVTPEILGDLEPLLLSPNDDVYEEAFLRVEELGVSELTRPYFEFIAINGKSEWIREKAARMLNTFQLRIL